MLTPKDRLRWFGTERVFARCEGQGAEGVLIPQGEGPGFEEKLTLEVLAILTVLSAGRVGEVVTKSAQLTGAFA